VFFSKVTIIFSWHGVITHTVECGAGNDIDRASSHGLSTEAAFRSNFHACVQSELLKLIV